jgi:hypothetical protein
LISNSDLRLGGRLYAVGGQNFQNLPREDRRLIRVGGARVVEVDIHGTFLTLLLGLCGMRELPTGDLYDAVGLPRAVTKVWMVRTFATGKPAGRWGHDTPPEVQAFNVKPSEVRVAALRTYPPLANLDAILPADSQSRLPQERHGWAVGQFLTNLESRVMDSALGYVEARGVVGLPMHDAIIVPENGARDAANGLRDDCWAVAHIEPRVRVSA